MTNYYWLSLLTYWVNTKHRNGLSIPFILGARTIIDPNFKIDENSVRDLLTEIRNSDINYIINFQHCENIGEYILGLNNPLNSMDGLEIKNEWTRKTKIIATLNTSVLGKTFDEISKTLTDRYKDCLSKGNYSRNDFKWTTFSELDLKFINEVLLIK